MTSKSIYSSDTPFKPTFLYIKRHTETGLLYFGKTTRNPEKYLGSGTHWKNHIIYHGKDKVENLWYCLFIDKEMCTQFAINFSVINNIVESVDWANEIVEDGLDTPFSNLSQEIRQLANKNSKITQEQHKIGLIWDENTRAEAHIKSNNTNKQNKTSVAYDSELRAMGVETNRQNGTSLGFNDETRKTALEKSHATQKENGLGFWSKEFHDKSKGSAIESQRKNKTGFFSEDHKEKTKLQNEQRRENSTGSYSVEGRKRCGDLSAKLFKGTHYYNNGTIEGRFHDGNVPDHWVRGRVPKKIIVVGP